MKCNTKFAGCFNQECLKDFTCKDSLRDDLYSYSNDEIIFKALLGNKNPYVEELAKRFKSFTNSTKENNKKKKKV